MAKMVGLYLIMSWNYPLSLSLDCSQKEEEKTQKRVTELWPYCSRCNHHCWRVNLALAVDIWKHIVATSCSLPYLLCFPTSIYFCKFTVTLMNGHHHWTLFCQLGDPPRILLLANNRKVHMPQRRKLDVEIPPAKPQHSRWAFPPSCQMKDMPSSWSHF